MVSSAERRELLELAARAAGYNLEWTGNQAFLDQRRWDPLESNDDADVLAAKLNLRVMCGSRTVQVVGGRYTVMDGGNGKPSRSIVRLTIVRAAAALASPG